MRTSPTNCLTRNHLGRVNSLKNLSDSKTTNSCLISDRSSSYMPITSTTTFTKTRHRLSSRMFRVYHRWSQAITCLRKTFKCKVNSFSSKSPKIIRRSLLAKRRATHKTQVSPSSISSRSTKSPIGTDHQIPIKSRSRYKITYNFSSYKYLALHMKK